MVKKLSPLSEETFEFSVGQTTKIVNEKCQVLRGNQFNVLTEHHNLLWLIFVAKKIKYMLVVSALKPRNFKCSVEHV